jgi:hypothetical protein
MLTCHPGQACEAAQQRCRRDPGSRVATRRSRALSLVAAFTLPLIATHASWAADTTVTAANEEIAALMKITKIVGIFPKGPASEFKADEDPETLQILFLDKPEDGPSRVSDDGEVFFRQTDISQPDDQRLINQAFILRAAHREKNER